MVVGVLGAVGYGATGAFFSDTETSTGNVFAAGAIDLRIDNESYYNGVLNPNTSWSLTDLTIERFFDFQDLKPNDYGEDTISLHVDTNEAYMCANVTLTSNEENGINDPEGDDGDVTDGPGEGELAGLVNFIWWADDGDNVLESNENVISQGPIGTLPLNQPHTVALADSDENIWEENGGGPVPAGVPLYIGKAWCFGTMGTLPLTPDNYPDGPAGDNDNQNGAGQPEDGGITCDGSGLDNQSQTDSLTADVSFEAVQARHNDNFQCEECEINTEQTLIPDSGFENPEVSTAQNWNIFDSPAGAWNVAWRDDIPAIFGPQNRPDPAHLEIHEGVLGAAFEGDQYAELDTDWGGPTDGGTGEPASVMIYQDIPTTPGTAYQIVFAFAARPNTPASDNRLEVGWGGTVAHDTGNVADGNAGIEWQEITVDVVATTSTTRLSFTDRGTANSLGTFLDDVRLYQEVCASPIGNDNNGNGNGNGGIVQGLFEDGFGNGTTDVTFDEDPTWEEGGGGAEKSGPAGQGESSSPNGNRFARMEGTDGYICREIDAAGFHDLELSYYWRGEGVTAPSPGDVGLAQYATGGTCAAPTGQTTVATHDLTDSDNPPWKAHSVDLGAVNNSSFLLFFRADTGSSNVDFRIDGVALSGVPN